MNRRALLTGVATLAVWPMAIRSRPRRDVRVGGGIPEEWLFYGPREWTGEYIERALMENRDLIEHMAWARGSI